MIFSHKYAVYLQAAKGDALAHMADSHGDKYVPTRAINFNIQAEMSPVTVSVILKSRGSGLWDAYSDGFILPQRARGMRMHAVSTIPDNVLFHLSSAFG